MKTMFTNCSNLTTIKVKNESTKQKLSTNTGLKEGVTFELVES